MFTLGMAQLIQLALSHVKKVSGSHPQEAKAFLWVLYIKGQLIEDGCLYCMSDLLYK